DGGEHRQPAYLALNPQGRVPALQVDEGELLIQSPAIIEYLEERYPQPALLSSDPLPDLLFVVAPLTQQVEHAGVVQRVDVAADQRR
ncbi:glutathione S-transferase N-terminal domain-containing protein, partial [Pseudomonas aeruginosa]|uniref:glutathione S-transferase N-terminal domain-containing protein n=1 Tax=Pseudomonas aeruginosa TaxID=287 RepID=UPI002551F07E